MHHKIQHQDGSTRFVDENGREALRIPDDNGPEFYGVTFSLGAEAADGIAVTIQVTDRAGNPIAKRVRLAHYFAVADGSQAISNPTSLTVTAGIRLGFTATTSSPGWSVTNASGVLTLVPVIAGAATRTCVVILPDGRVVESGTITWAA